MSTVHEIEEAIRKLAPGDLHAFRRWFAEFDAGMWDQQFEADVAAGRLDKLAVVDTAGQLVSQRRSRRIKLDPELAQQIASSTESHPDESNA